MPRAVNRPGVQDMYSLGYGGRLDLDGSSLEHADGVLSDLIRQFSPGEVNDILSDAAVAAQHIASKHLEKNYHAAGLQVKTGKLLEAVKKSTLHIKGRGRNLYVHVRMEANVRKYDEPKQKKAHFYNAAGALNYGGVYNSNTSRRGREKIKAGTPTSQTKGARYVKKDFSLGKSFYAYGRKSEAAKGRVSGGDVVRVTRGFDYYQLDSRQLAEVVDSVLRYFVSRLQWLARGAA